MTEVMRGLLSVMVRKICDIRIPNRDMFSELVCGLQKFTVTCQQQSDSEGI